MKRFANRWTCGFFLSLSCGLALLQSAGAQNEQPGAAGAEPSGAVVVPSGRSSGPRAAVPQGSFPPAETVLKEMIKQPGLLTLYRNDPRNPAKDPTALLAEIPAGLLGQDLLLSVSGSQGPMAGWMMGGAMIRFQMVGTQMKIVVPNVKYMQKAGDPVTDAVARTYTDEFLTALPVVTINGGDPVVDMTPLVMTNVVQAMVPGAIRRDLSRYTATKTFPDNVLINVELATMRGPGGGESVGLAYGLRRLPPLGSYRPRLADERVGYFTTDRENWNADHAAREMAVRLINRWSLEKRDPSLALSPPVQPIVFYIEKTVPVQWRRWVQAGILEWNKAFEKVGFSEAIVVRQQTDDNEYKDLDPEDSRYNFIRWIVTGMAFAMGPSTADPRTGQLLDADIIVDDSMLRYMLRESDIFSSSSSSVGMLGEKFQRYLESHPRLMPEAERKAQKAAGQAHNHAHGHVHAAGGPTSRPGATNSPFFSRPPVGCDYATGMTHQVALVRMAAMAAGKDVKLPEHLFGELIKDLISHEVGHTLGLRHNFKASSWLSIEEIKRRRDTTDEPLFASVMDYCSNVLMPGDDVTKLRHITSPGIGPYDMWAIEYGYRPGPPGDAEKAMLAKIASRTNEPGLAFATDEDTMGSSSPDPFSIRYDMSNDPVAWAKARGELADQLLAGVRKWGVKPGDPNYYLQPTVAKLLMEKAVNLDHLAMMVGGQHFNRNRPGDPGFKPALQLVDPAKQRQALAVIAQTAFTDKYFQLPADLVMELAPSRWGMRGARVDFPIHDFINMLQSYALFDLMSPAVLQRVYDSELKSDAKDKFTAAELLNAVRKAIWSELAANTDAAFTNASPMISSIRRNLQIEHLTLLLGMMENGPMSPDLRNMARFSARTLSEEIGQTLKKMQTAEGSRLDLASRAHLSEAKSRIDRALEAKYISQ